MHGSKIKLFLIARHISITGTKLPFQKAVSGVKFVPPAASPPQFRSRVIGLNTWQKQSLAVVPSQEDIPWLMNWGRWGYNIRYHGHSTSLWWIPHPVMVSGTSAHCSKGERDKDRVSQFLLSEHVPFRPLSLFSGRSNFGDTGHWRRANGRTGEWAWGLEVQRHNTVDLLFCGVLFSELPRMTLF